MCGITGYFHFSSHPEPISDKPLKEMLALIHHRGPDDTGVAMDDWFALGHKRLSIIDTSDHGHQPMWCSQNRYVLIYNGELYNYKALRRELEALGQVFISHSDTEVLLKALIVWGQDAFAKCEGMFAGVFVDTQSRRAMIFRDQLGIKPLYIAQGQNGFCFSSEIKSLKPYLGSWALNEAAIGEHFQYRYVAGERTLFAGIERLTPGTCLMLEPGGGITKHKFYNVLDGLKDHPAGRVDVDDIEAALKDSITAHTVSDVGYSIQLSGGVDSSYITTILSQSDKSLDTYSVALPGDPENDEAPYQDLVSHKCATVHHRLACTGRDFADLFPKVTYHLDFPVVHGGTVFLQALCRKIQERHKVVLTGEGADELFLGYSRYQIPWSHQAAFLLRGAGLKPGWVPALPKLRGLRHLLSKDLGLAANSFDGRWDDLLSVQGDAPFRQSVKTPYHTLLGQMIALDQTAYLGSLLERQDKVSMAHSLEVRVPFCNHKLFDLLNRMRHSQKINPVPKAILKELLARVYPKDFVYRKKNGFKLPFRDWFNDDKIMGGYLDLLADQSFRERPFYRHGEIQTMIEKHRKQERDFAKEIYALVAFEVWIREFKL